MVTGGTLFEELGFYYVGPIDGHNLHHLIPVLENVRDTRNGPILVHVVTQKGKGYAPAEASADKYHGHRGRDRADDDKPAGRQGVGRDLGAHLRRIRGYAHLCDRLRDDRDFSRLAHIATATSQEVHAVSASVGWFGLMALLLKAYSMGAGTYTGIEAVCSGLPILREPRVRTGRRTMVYMGVSLALTVAGLLVAYQLYDVQINPDKTLNAVLFDQMTLGWNHLYGLVRLGDVGFRGGAPHHRGADRLP